MPLALFSSAERIRRDSARHSPKEHTEVREANDDCKTPTHETEILVATTIKTTHRSLVALSLPKSVPALIVYAQGIVKRMTGNPSFPNSEPALAAVGTAIADLQTAEAAALSRIKGAAADSNERARLAVLHEDNDSIRSLCSIALRMREGWQPVVAIVQPETLLRWHRDGFRSLWRRKSKPAGGLHPDADSERRQGWEGVGSASADSRSSDTVIDPCIAASLR